MPSAIAPANHFGALAPMTSQRACNTSHHFAATVSRQFSLWPFGTSTLRMYLLVDPSDTEPGLAAAMLRAMQQEYFRSEARSQTNAVRSVILAAHYVLRHRNSDALPHDRITAAAGCLVARGTTAYIALAGDVCAFAWDGKRLDAHRPAARAARPVGGDAVPRVSLWSAPLGPGNRIALVCGAAPDDATLRDIGDVLCTAPPGAAQQRLSELAGVLQPSVRALVAESAPAVLTEHGRHGHQRPRRDRGKGQARALRPDPASRRAARLLRQPRPVRLLLPMLLLLALFAGALVAVNPFAEPRSVALAREAEADLNQLHQVDDAYQAHALAATAATLAREAATAAPDKYLPLSQQCEQTLMQVDRVVQAQLSVVVRLGPRTGSVADIATSRNALFTLDVAEGAVHRYRTDLDQQEPTPDTVFLRQGAVVDGRAVDAPVAMTYVPAPSGGGRLVVVDRARTIVEVRDDGTTVRRSLSGMSWKRVSALGAGADGALYIVDGDEGTLFAYPTDTEQTSAVPRQVLSRTLAPDLPFDRVVGLLPGADLYVSTDDASVQRFSRQGRRLAFDVRAPDGAIGPVSGMASDAGGTMYLADVGHHRLVQATADGRFVRQIRGSDSWDLGSLRSLQLSPDGTTLFAVNGNGVVALALPGDVPAPLQPASAEEPEATGAGGSTGPAK